LARIFTRYGRDVALVVNTAAQPSHDWALRDPYTDFDINATGTLNLLQNVREHCIEAPFIQCSTNKVYGDRPNSLPLVELETRWEIEPGHPYEDGITEDMPIDHCLHSVFGASKVAADVMAQEYGRYFGMRTACFRGGTLTGPAHAATELHGFLAYVMRCNMERRTYKIFGYKGKMVRDAIHSHDVVAAFEAFFRAPREGRPFALTALAVHGVMTGVQDRAHGARLNSFDLVTPDGQPVRWALNSMYGAALADRVYGPTLTLRVLDRAAAEGLPIYLYGSTDETLDRLVPRLQEMVPALKIAGREPSKFRAARPGELVEIAEGVKAS